MDNIRIFYKDCSQGIRLEFRYLPDGKWFGYGMDFEPHQAFPPDVLELIKKFEMNPLDESSLTQEGFLEE